MPRYLYYLLSIGAVGAAIASAACGDNGDPPPTAADAPPTSTTPPPTATATPTPTPSPTPRPFAFEYCYSTSSAAASQAQPSTGTPSPMASATPSPTEISVQPSMFPGCQLVAFYGHPGNPAMGVLGEGTTEEMLARLQAESDLFAASNGGRRVVPGFHIIAAVAQASPGPDGTYLARLTHDELDRWVALAEEHDFFILLDLQMGHSTVDAEVGYYRDYLANPRVHLALDPEWAMASSGVPPGQQIGNMDASEINRAQEILQQLAEENGLPSKILVVHQFQAQMIRSKETLTSQPNVELVIHMDGFGPPAPKIGGYNRFVRDDGAPHGGFKLFYDEDIDRLTAAEVNALTPPPDVITFQ